MSQALKVYADELRRGMEYKVVYKGRRGGDPLRMNGKTLRYRNITLSGVAEFPYSLNFVEDSDPNARYAISLYAGNGQQFDFNRVDADWDFFQMYTGPMAAGHGPEAGVMPENRRAAAAPPAGPAAAGASGGRRSRLRKTRKSRRRGSRKSRTARR